MSIEKKNANMTTRIQAIIMPGMGDRLSQLRNLLEQDPADAFCMYGIAMEHLREGRRDEAIAWFDQAIEVEPGQTYAYYHKARCLGDAGRTQEAFATIDTGLAQARECGDSHAEEELLALARDLS
jgi:tetratricopeptide (TPR) repeat protein